MRSSTSVPQPNLLETALSYVRRGYRPIPLCWPVDGGCGCGRCESERDIGKRPLLGEGYQHLHPTDADVARWWRRWPHANIGLLLEPHLLLIDCDGAGAVAEAQEWGLPPTLTVARGPNRHFYYRRPQNAPARRRTKQGKCRAIDVLASGYVVAPPSLHRSEDRYEVIERRPIAPAPAWAVEILQQAGEAATVASEAPWLPPLAGLRLSRRMQDVLLRGRDADPMRYPSRSEALYAVIVAAVAAGHSDGEILSALLAQPWVRTMRRRPENWLPPQIAKARRSTTVRGRSRAPLRVVVGS